MSDTISVIDIGTNSALLLVVRYVRGEFVSIYEESQTPRLGAGFAETGRIAPQSTARLVKTLRHYKQISAVHGASVILAVGTQVFRMARNAREVIHEVADRTGIRIMVLSSRQEASYAFCGALSGLPYIQSGVLVDIGGGSTELVPFHRRTIVSTLSLPLGCVTLAETCLRRFYGISDRRVETARAMVGKLFRKLSREYRRSFGSIIGVGGTVTTLAALDQRLRTYRADRVHGYHLNGKSIEQYVERFRRTPAAQLRQAIRFDPDRAAVLPAGTFLWAEVLKHLSARCITVSHRGLRWGLALEYFTKTRR